MLLDLGADRLSLDGGAPSDLASWAEALLMSSGGNIQPLENMLISLPHLRFFFSIDLAYVGVLSSPGFNELISCLDGFQIMLQFIADFPLPECSG